MVLIEYDNYMWANGKDWYLSFPGFNKNLQLVALTTTTRYPLFNEHTFGMPMPSSYVPLGHSALTDKMSFTERLVSFLEHNLLSPILAWNIAAPLNKLKVHS